MHPGSIQGFFYKNKVKQQHFFLEQYFFQIKQIVNNKLFSNTYQILIHKKKEIVPKNKNPQIYSLYKVKLYNLSGVSSGDLHLLSTVL